MANMEPRPIETGAIKESLSVSLDFSLPIKDSIAFNLRLNFSLKFVKHLILQHHTFF